MAKRNLGEKIKLSTYDEMFGTDTFGHDDQKTEGQIINIPLSELHTFKDHPFRVLDDEKMEETVESIKASLMVQTLSTIQTVHDLMQLEMQIRRRERRVKPVIALNLHLSGQMGIIESSQI